MPNNMSELEIQHFIRLLNKWKKDELTWGECCELREYKYLYSESIEQYYRDWQNN